MRAPIVRWLTGRWPDGRSLVVCCAVQVETGVWAERAVAYWAREHDIHYPEISRTSYRKPTRRDLWLRVPSEEEWKARREMRRLKTRGGRSASTSRVAEDMEAMRQSSPWM